MPADWNAAAAAIAAAFQDVEQVHYIRDGRLLGPFPIIRSERAAPAFPGAGDTLRMIAYELGYQHLTARPRNGDTVKHRGRSWEVTNVTDLDDVSAWQLVVEDVGPVS